MGPRRLCVEGQLEAVVGDAPGQCPGVSVTIHSPIPFSLLLPNVSCLVTGVMGRRVGVGAEGPGAASRSQDTVGERLAVDRYKAGQTEHQ